METVSNEELVTILKSPSLFMWKMLGIKPLSYQVQILEDDSRNILIVGGRQIGKSLTLAAKATWRAFVKPNEDILILARNLRQAKIIFDHIYRYVSSNSFIAQHTTKKTISEVRFDNGSVIRCLPSGRAGEGIRGFSATMVIFDEAAFIPEEVFVALNPSLAVRGAQVVYSSTPYGKRGFFYQAYEDQKSRIASNRTFSIYEIPSRMNPYMKVEVLEMEKRLKTAAQYAQEYEAQFVDEAGMFFPYSLVYSCIADYDYAFPKKIEEGDKFLLGVDVGYTGDDETALCVIRENKMGDRRVQYIEAISKTTIPQITGRVLDLFKAIPFSRIYIDKTGVGAGAYDLLKEGIGSTVVGVEFSEHNRDRMYGNLKLALEQKTLELNSSDTKMIYQFSSYMAKYDITGKLRLTKDLTIHDDLVDALALTFIDKGGFKVGVLDQGMDFSYTKFSDNRPHVVDRRWFGIDEVRQ